MKRFTAGASSQASKRQRTQGSYFLHSAHSMSEKENPLDSCEPTMELSDFSQPESGDQSAVQPLQSMPTFRTSPLSSEPVQNSQREKGSSGSAGTIYRNYLKFSLLRELLAALKKDTPKQYMTDEDKVFFEFLKLFEVGLTKFDGPSLKAIKATKEKVGARTRLLLEQEYQLIYIFICILRYKDASPRNKWLKTFISEFVSSIKNIKQLNGNTFNALYVALGREWIKAKFPEINKDPIAPKDLLSYDENKCYEVPDKGTLLRERDKEALFRTSIDGEETFYKYFIKHSSKASSAKASSAKASSAKASSAKASSAKASSAKASSVKVSSVKVSSESTITVYRDYLNFSLLRELLVALEKGPPKQRMTDEEEMFFEFIKHLEVGLTKFEGLSLQAISVEKKKAGVRALDLLQQEYQLTYVFICVLRYKDKSSRNGWIKTFPHEFISDIKNIKKNKLNNNTFRYFCSALGKERIKYFFSQIQEDPIAPEGLLSYEENGCYKIPDKDTLLRERNKKEIFRTSCVDGEETFSKYLLKYCSHQEPAVQTNIQMRVSSNPSHSERENSRVFTANTGLSFFNSNPSDTTTREIIRRDGNIAILIPPGLQAGNTEKEVFPSSNIMARGPALGDDGLPYNGVPMTPNCFNSLSDDSLASPENGFELSPIFAEDEMMPLEGERETFYLAEHPPILPSSSIISEDRSLFTPTRVSSNPFQSERESSRVFTTGLQTGNPEKEVSLSSNIMIRGPALGDDGLPYNGVSMTSDCFNSLSEDPFASPENGFELSPIFAEDEMMSLEGERETFYLAEYPPILPSASSIILEDASLFMPMQSMALEGNRQSVQSARALSATILSAEPIENSQTKKGSSETTTTAYRNYLKLSLLRELLAALKKDAPTQLVTAEDEVFFEFLEHLEVGLTKLNEFPVGRKKKEGEVGPGLSRILEQEYHLTYIFICLLRYKDRRSRNEWVKTFIPEFMHLIKNIKKLKANTFNSLCEALGKKWIKANFLETQEDSIALKGLRRYNKDECYEVPDKATLLQERDKETLFRTRVEGEKTFYNYFLKYCLPEEPLVQTTTQTRVSSNPFQSERESSSVFTTNTGLSFFNSNFSDTTTRGIISRDENIGILTPQEWQTGNTEKEVFPSSNIMARGSEFGDDGLSYNGASMAPDCLDWLRDSPTPPESWFELSPIFAENEEMPLEEQEENSQTTQLFQSERESSRVFTTNTGLSFFNSHSLTTTTEEISKVLVP